MNLRDRLRERIQHRLNERPDKQRLVYELVAECRTCTTRRQVEDRVAAVLDERRETRGVRFGFFEVLAIIRIVILIWNLLRDLDVLTEATPEMIEGVVWE